MPTPPPIRVATAADVPGLQRLIHSAYRGEDSRAGWTHEADLLDGNRIDEDMLRAELADPGTTLFLTEDDAGPLGCCVVTDRGDGTAYFGTFAVRPTAQGAGLGDALLRHAESHARGLGATRMELTVVAQRSDLIAWYARRGYTPTGETRPFPYGDERFGLPRRDDLAFAVLVKSLP
ncbi:GNAT family N-acetyltransferase [Sporichthya polymorpha]|uniref:GNAT family N-acetyltransferase n=1 Tax=Sporichthya polymorpha TaxID=35751 RepID=UPI00035FDAFB|nr:GNAT family N-acetyltransferase [Sporichthya polymorpha]